MIPRRRYEVAADLAAVLASERPWTRPVVDGDWQAGVCRRLAAVFGVPDTSDALLTASGRHALLTCLSALNVPKAATVMLPSWTFVGVQRALHDAGYATAVCDVGVRAPVMEADHVRSSVQRLSRETDAPNAAIGALVVTHLFGRVVHPDVVRWAHSQGIVVIEDVAHAVGARRGSTLAGQFGDAAIFSLDTLKPIAGLGGGLAVIHRKARDPNSVWVGPEGLRDAASDLQVASSPQFARRVALACAEIAVFSVHGGPALRLAELAATHADWFRQRDDSVRRAAPGGAFHRAQGRIATRQAASWPNRLRARRQMAARVCRSLDVDDALYASAPAEDEAASAYFLVLCANDGDAGAVGEALRAAGVDTGAGRGLADVLEGGDNANAKKWAAAAIQLPCGAGYSEREIARLCRILAGFRGRLRLSSAP